MKGFMNGEDLYSPSHRKVTPSMAFYDVIGSTSGSFNIFPCRLFGLTPAQYLRMVRDKYGAILQGKTGYITYHFSDTKQCDALVKELNRRWEIFLGRVAP